MLHTAVSYEGVFPLVKERLSRIEGEGIMSIAWTIAISVIVAAFVGGVTNHLAIKMLFHPRYELRVAGKRVPFTPGLIPKRKNEITKSLGSIVAVHLVTSDGLVEMLQKGPFRERCNNTILAWINERCTENTTLEQYIQRFVKPEFYASARAQLVAWLEKAVTERGIEWLWEEKGLSERRLGDLLQLSFEHKEALSGKAADWLVTQIVVELSTPDGERMLRKITGQMLEQAGGMLGTLASIFVDEEKLTMKVKQAIFTQLKSPALHRTLTDFFG